MHGWETRMRLKHYLDQGVTKAELSRRFGIARSHDPLLDRVGAAGPRPGGGSTRQARRGR